MFGSPNQIGLLYHICTHVWTLEKYCIVVTLCKRAECQIRSPASTFVCIDEILQYKIKLFELISKENDSTKHTAIRSKMRSQLNPPNKLQSQDLFNLKIEEFQKIPCVIRAKQPVAKSSEPSPCLINGAIVLHFEKDFQEMVANCLKLSYIKQCIGWQNGLISSIGD